MRIVNNPFEVVMQAVEELYPGTKAEIQFNPNIKYRKWLFFKCEHCGSTFFPDDGGTPIIDISTNIPFEAMVETLGHELAHVVAGVDEGHGKEWQKAFDNIRVKYHEIFKVKFVFKEG